MDNAIVTMDITTLLHDTQVVAAYKKRGLKLATVLYGKESAGARRWREQATCEEWTWH